MGIELISPERFEEVQRALREDAQDAGAEPLNILNTIDLFGPSILTLRGRRYEVPPVSFKDGLRVLALQHKLGALSGKPATAEVLAALDAVRAEVAVMFPRMTRRVGWLRWFPTRVPRRMTEGEALHVLGFFLGARTKDLASFRSGAATADLHR